MSEQQKEVYNAIIATTIIFLLIALALISLVFVYNRRKKRHIEEKEQMKLTFESELAKTRFEVQEQTMQTIGTDLHDNIGQLLSLTSLTLNSVELQNALKAREKIDAAIDLTMQSIKEMRLLGKLLQGDQLVVSGLSEAIRYQINWVERSGNYEISYLEEREVPAGNSPAKDLILFRILQEILNNIIKHARATYIAIKLDYFDAKLHLSVADNGIGFNNEETAAEQRGMGLQNIQKRAAIIGGGFTIDSVPGKGTNISVFIPYP